ncbi:MAG: hypothetical protein VYB44_07460 [Bacteroidota bacterium]|nr:hypothetical protein [Bacteroidota bacterium]
MEGKDIKQAVTERFYEAIEKLISDHKADNYRDIERQTGIEHQRINAIKSYLKKGSRPAYPLIEYCVQLCSTFKISYYWLMEGQGPFYYQENQEYTFSDVEVGMFSEERGDVEYKSSSLVDRISRVEQELAKLKGLVGA